MNPINEDAREPQDGRTGAAPEPAPRKPLNSSWGFTVAGGLIGAYFLISGALMVRDKHGNGVFALLMTAVLVLVAVFALLLFRSYQKEKAARE
ncbi:hypothetical protein [Actinoplanes sp. DH11]|uniref:hypothetical protein n=1 Tax=Actinoplanes sp. DH11 TaxID=2857011 RepID=UPI001E2F4A68|nr:hypothetical protein [Actinoplanes sp. DH11]